MEPIDKKRIILIAAVVVVIVAVVVAFVVVGGKQINGPGGAGGHSETANSKPSSASATRLLAPTNVVVPEAGAQNISSSVAVPKVESAAASGADAKYRSFNIIVENGQFMPSTIAVNQGDTVNLQIGAVGGDYDFTQPDYGLRVPLPNGKNKTFQFAATAAGKFVFYCSSCGGPAKGPVGYLIVAAK